VTFVTPDHTGLSGTVVTVNAFEGFDEPVVLCLITTVSTYLVFGIAFDMLAVLYPVVTVGPDGLIVTTAVSANGVQLIPNPVVLFAVRVPVKLKTGVKGRVVKRPTSESRGVATLAMFALTTMAYCVFNDNGVTFPNVAVVPEIK
jgi:hypothetical protein